MSRLFELMFEMVGAVTSESFSFVFKLELQLIPNIETIAIKKMLITFIVFLLN
ncbi:MAG: hypothetical protein KDC25_04265 [Saprospiraceae bacterium]|nr:hypothetical protein [Saprospiraceae bacterium]